MKKTNVPLPMHDAPIDLRGLQCPMPVLMLRRRLKSIPSGQKVEVWVTDAKAQNEFMQYCSISGDNFVSWEPLSNYYRAMIVRK